LSKQLRTSLLSILIVLSACIPVSASSFTGQVVGVIDCDTIDVLRSGKEERIRLNGIDCPEKKQAYGTRAKQFTSDLAFKRTVTVVYMDTDRYGRIIGEVFFTDGKNLCHEIVKAGYAWWYRQYAPDDKELKALEKNARASQRGLWADPDPIRGIAERVLGVLQPINLNNQGLHLVIQEF